MNAAKLIKKVGEYTLYAGVGATILMACVGSVAVDLVFIAALNQNVRENRVSDFWLTFWMWQCFSPASSHPLLLLLISPLLTAVAIGLSVALNVTAVGLYLALGWSIAATTLLLGHLTYQFGAWLEQPLSSQRTPSVNHFSFFSTGIATVRDGAESCFAPLLSV